MNTNNFCPDCKKTYEKMPTQCICGWYAVKEINPVDRSQCHFFEEYGQCQEAGSVALRSKSHDWYCSKHAEKLREESYKRT